MHAPERSWQFASSFDRQRRESLERVASYAQIVEIILAEAVVATFRVCRGKKGLLGQCCRPEFELTISAETADLFFNGPSGYRAQYLADPDEGQKQNARLIAALSDRLISYAKTHPAKIDMSIDRVRLALLACSAKAWLPEASFVFNHDLVEEVVVPIWHRNALAARAAFRNNTRPNPEQQEKAIWGIQAPRAKALEVKGAFLSDSNDEVVPSDKIDRRLDIHQFGYA